MLQNKIIVLGIVYTFLSPHPAIGSPFDEIREEIVQRGAQWRAGVTAVSHMQLPASSKALSDKGKEN